MYQNVGKRLGDLWLAAIGLVLLSPVLALLFVVLLCAQGRPVLFSHTRVGQHFVPFKLYKFRSMSSSGHTQESGFSPELADRRTPIGRFIRGSKLDELPQLWNVLRGDMALVGPRPEVPQWVDGESELWQEVLSVRPGITDTASIHFFDEEQQLRLSESPEELYGGTILPEKLRLASAYARNVTFIGDARIVLQTFAQLFRR
ncbi:MAG: sugar transferase [Granulosicoccus sp.]